MPHTINVRVTDPVFGRSQVAARPAAEFDAHEALGVVIPNGAARSI